MKNQENKFNQTEISDNDLKQVTGGELTLDRLKIIDKIAVASISSELLAIDAEPNQIFEKADSEKLQAAPESVIR